VDRKERRSFLPLEMFGRSHTTPATNRTWQNWLSVCISSDTLHSSEGHPAEQVRVRVLLTLPQALPSQESSCHKREPSWPEIGTRENSSEALLMTTTEHVMTCLLTPVTPRSWYCFCSSNACLVRRLHAANLRAATFTFACAEVEDQCQFE
jgi:hypothetical protein